MIPSDPQTGSTSAATDGQVRGQLTDIALLSRTFGDAITAGWVSEIFKFLSSQKSVWTFQTAKANLALEQSAASRAAKSLRLESFSLETDFPVEVHTLSLAQLSLLLRLDRAKRNILVNSFTKATNKLCPQLSRLESSFRSASAVISFKNDSDKSSWLPFDCTESLNLCQSSFTAVTMFIDLTRMNWSRRFCSNKRKKRKKTLLRPNDKTSDGRMKTLSQSAEIS